VVVQSGWERELEQIRVAELEHPFLQLDGSCFVHRSNETFALAFALATTTPAVPVTEATTKATTTTPAVSVTEATTEAATL